MTIRLLGYITVTIIFTGAFISSFFMGRAQATYFYLRHKKALNDFIYETFNY